MNESIPHTALYVYAFLALTGICSGFLSGLLSIGGGFVLVPALLLIFGKFYSFDAKYEIQLVLGSTMCCMIFSSISATYHQITRGSIDWVYITENIRYIVLGTVIGVLATSIINGPFIKATFAMFCGVSAYKMIFKKPNAELVEISKHREALTTVAFAILCGGIGVGGATLVVPHLLKKGVGMRNALGAASAFQVPVAVVGTTAYIVLGLATVEQAAHAPGALGFVFLPAALIITVLALLFSKLGVNVAHRLPVLKLRKIMGVFTMMVGIKIITDLRMQ